MEKPQGRAMDPKDRGWPLTEARALLPLNQRERRQ